MIRAILFLIWEFLKHSINMRLKPRIASDEFPTGHGRFGFDPTNPIPCKGFHGPRLFMEKLKFSDGATLRFERYGSTDAENIPDTIIDCYQVYRNGKEFGDLYLAPFQKRTSQKLPEGFSWN